MGFVISFAVGAVVGAIIVFFVARNNVAKAIEAITKTQEKEEA